MKMRRWIIFGILMLLLVPTLAGVAGAMIGGGVLHPPRRELKEKIVASIEKMFAEAGAKREDFNIKAFDGVLLRGWKVRAAQPNGDWVLLFHGVSDNRVGMYGHAEFLLRAGYSVVMMDSRAHGASEGPMATFGWLERHDTQAVVNALYANEAPHCLFELGESMGAAIALQSAEIEQRVVGVVAESSFADLREVTCDYAGFRMFPWLGKTLLRPAANMAIKSAEKEGGFRAEDISPEKSVAARTFPVYLICGLSDRNIPARHTKRIYEAAKGQKEIWLVPGAGHTMAPGTAPEEFKRRVSAFFAGIHTARSSATKQ